MSVSVPVIDYIDPNARKIYLLAGVTEYHPLDDIYAEVRYLRRTDETLQKYFNFVEGGGNIPKNVTGTLRTPRYAIFKNCQVVLSDDTLITGEQLYADSNGDVVGKGPACIDHALSPANAYADYAPPEAETLVIEVPGSGLTVQESAQLDGIFAAFLHRQALLDGATSNFVIYEADGFTPKYVVNVTDKDGNAIILEPGVPAERSSAV